MQMTIFNMAGQLAIVQDVLMHSIITTCLDSGKFVGNGWVVVWVS